MTDSPTAPPPATETQPKDPTQEKFGPAYTLICAQIGDALVKQTVFEAQVKELLAAALKIQAQANSELAPKVPEAV